MFKKIQVSEAPKRSRTGISRFEKTREWHLMKAEIDKGLKPNEALVAVLTDEDKKKYQIKNRRTISRFVKKYLVSRKLKYTVTSFHKAEGDTIIVKYLPVIRQTA